MIKELKKAISVSTPLIAINTVDQTNTLQSVVKQFGEFPILSWDCLNGLLIRSEKSKQKAKAIKQIMESGTVNIPGGESISAPIDCKNISNMLVSLANPALDSCTKPNESPVGADAIVIMLNAHRFINTQDDDGNRVSQGLMTLRNILASNGRTLIMLGPDFSFPSEIAQDIYVINEALPSTDEIKQQIIKLYSETNTKVDDDIIDTATAALKGLPAFAIKQAASLAVDFEDSGQAFVVKDDLWKRKKQMLDTIPGLTMLKWGPTFDDIGELSELKSFFMSFFNGPYRPNVLVFIDEFDKMISGARPDGGGDTSGVSQDQAGVLLNKMEAYKWFGATLLGIPGTGKSFMAECIASTFQIPIVAADFNAAKDSLMGSSEKRVRGIINGIHAMAGDDGEGKAFFIVTANRLHTISPEMRRRFSSGGLWFVDLPNAEGRANIGKIQTKYYGLTDNPEFWKNKEGWSGANIKNCCFLAKGMNISLEQASKRVISADKQDAVGIDALRRLAHNAFLSADYPGEYRYTLLDKENEPVVEYINSTRKFQKGN